MSCELPLDLVCPRDKASVEEWRGELRCGFGHVYPIIDGIPVMLLDDVRQTHRAAVQTLVASRARENRVQPTFVSGIDDFVQREIAATNGRMYRTLVGRLSEYPIPTLRLPREEGRSLLLDIGCNWGRWCIAGARRGYVPVGIDPNIDAVRAARRVARQLDVTAHFLVADGRFLPFPDAVFNVVFSYSVLQHFAKVDAQAAFLELGRVLRPGGVSRIQLPNRWSILGTWHTLRRGREPCDFEVRYWELSEMRSTLERSVGVTTLSVDSFFSLNAQPAEAHLLPMCFRGLVAVSECLRRLSARVPELLHFADSIIATSRKDGGTPCAE